jgi:hypothetical protein
MFPKLKFHFPKPDRYYLGLLVTIWLLIAAVIYQSYALSRQTAKLNQLCTWEVIK